MKEDGNGLSELPQGWVRTTVGEIVTFEYGKGLRQDKRDSSGKIPVYGSNGVVGYHSTPLVEAPCLIVGRKGAAGQVHISNGPCWPIDTTYYVIPPEGIDLSFLYYLLSTLRLGSLDRSTAIPGLNRNDAYALSIPLPPLPEQQRIVAKIEELFTQLDAGVAALEKAKAQLRRYRQAVLKAAVEGELTREWREAHWGELEPASVLLERTLEERRARWESEQLEKMKAKGKVPKDDRWKRKYKKPASPDIEDLPELPEGWCWASVEQLSAHEPNSITDGPFGSNLKTAHYTEFGPRVVRLQNVGNGKFLDAKAHISEEHFETLRKYEVLAGNLVIAALGANVPRACIIPDYVGPAIVKADCIRFKPHSSLADARYLHAVLNSDLLKNIAKNIIHGVGRPRLNQQQIKSLPIPLPSLAEQHIIVEEVEQRLSVAEEMEKVVEQSLKRAERLRQSILKKASEGKLVPQDPTDEPAFVLLERIQAEKARREVEEKSGKRSHKKASQRSRKKGTPGQLKLL